jgi:Uma2 family endonuclease
MAQAKHKLPTLEEFLAWEEQQETRHEFVDGALFMMSGGTEAHDVVRLAIASTLRSKLAGGPCGARLDLKLVCPNGRSRYPDVAVVCGPRDPKATRLIDPVVLIEVLSPSTRSTDYLIKPTDYASVPSVTTYLIVDPDEPRIDILRRSGDRFEPEPQAYGREAVVGLPEIGIELQLAELYEAAEG